MKVNVKLPCLIMCNDYQEFNDLKYQIGTIIKGFQLKELGCDTGDYIGLAYVGKKPSPKIVQRLLDKENIDWIAKQMGPLSDLK